MGFLAIYMVFCHIEFSQESEISQNNFLQPKLCFCILRLKPQYDK